jgi:hypothetical protein
VNRIRLPFQAETLPVVYEKEDAEPTRRQRQVAEQIEAFSASIGPKIALASQAFYDDYADWGPAIEANVQRSDLLRHIHFEEVVIPRLGQSSHDWWFLSGRCDWEPEHGIEVLLDGSEVVSVGPCDCLFLNEEWDRYLID